MNDFGARDFALRLILIAVCGSSGALFAQDEPPPDSPTDIKPPPVDLIYTSVDLKYSSEGAGGAGVDLKSDIADLASKGVDVKENETEIKINLLGDILFDFNKADIRPVAEPTLATVAKLIQGRKNPKVLIEGHTDSKGSDSYNARLSDRRAVSVKDWFAKHGVTAGSMQTHGWGATKPVASNTHPDGSDDPEGRQKNRRVEITVKK
jgi:outer membrane protein OmpA-like peptidoglycan-associated protein